MGELLNAREVAAIWGCSPRAVRRWHRLWTSRAESHGRLLYWRLDDLYARHWRQRAAAERGR